jgi:hypothetical protein
MRAQIDEAMPTVGMLFQLVSIGLVAAATAIMFSIASFSFLPIDTETLTRSSTDHGGVEFNFIRYSPLRSIGGNATSIPARTTSLVPDTTLGISSPLRSETPSVLTTATPDLDVSADRDAGASILKPRGTSTRPTRSVMDTPWPEIGSFQVPPAEPIPLPDEVNAPGDASPRTMPATSTPAAEQKEILQQLELQQNQPAKRDEADLLSDAKAPAQNAQNGRDVGYPLSPHAAFRYRVRKECGPIDDPVLYLHCVASFGVHYR